jgi:hypothetical protein
MQTGFARIAVLGAVPLMTLGLLTPAGCVSSSGDLDVDTLFEPVPANTDAQVTVAGTWEWGAQRFRPLVEGEIDLSQDGDTVTVDQVRYFLNPVLRDLEGQAVLDGNVLTIQMRARDGTNYVADNVITFSEDGRRFTAEYIDSNGDDSNILGLTAGERIE